MRRRVAMPHNVDDDTSVDCLPQLDQGLGGSHRSTSKRPGTYAIPGVFVKCWSRVCRVEGGHVGDASGEPPTARLLSARAGAKRGCVSAGRGRIVPAPGGAARRQLDARPKLRSGSNSGARAREEVDGTMPPIGSRSFAVRSPCARPSDGRVGHDPAGAPDRPGE
jgi:hypothetical protein